jgi:hypothetical protein
MKDNINKITNRENLHPNMLKCVNCGAPAEFYVNNTRVCSDRICTDKYRRRGSESRVSNAKQRIYDAKFNLRRLHLESYIDLRSQPKYLRAMTGSPIDQFKVRRIEDTMDIEAVAKKISKWQQARRSRLERLEEAENELIEAHKTELKEYKEYLQEE